jgi:hypothetical protein
VSEKQDKRDGLTRKGADGKTYKLVRDQMLNCMMCAGNESAALCMSLGGDCVGYGVWQEVRL